MHQPWFELPSCSLPAGHFWTGHFSAQCLGFLRCARGQSPGEDSAGHPLLLHMCRSLSISAHRGKLSPSSQAAS